MKCHFVYSPEYDVSLFGVEHLHRFDSRKLSHAWSLFREAKPDAAAADWLRPAIPVTDEELELVHSPSYLSSLRSSAVVARAMEVWPIRLIPHALLQKHLLRPMRLAVRGTLMASECALRGEAAMSFGGGFHHAFRERGEGFCLYADVALAIAVHRASGLLKREERVAVIDLDAHRGNGFEAIVADDPTVSVFDLFNFQVYPGLSDVDIEDRPFMIPIRSGTTDDVYLRILDDELPRFLDTAGPVKIAFYNAGTDVVAGDRLGCLRLTPKGVRERDRRVVDALATRGIPMVVVTSGGYTATSHELVADLAVHLVDRLSS